MKIFCFHILKLNLGNKEELPGILLTSKAFFLSNEPVLFKIVTVKTNLSSLF